MENTKPLYCGSGKTRSGQYGDFQAVSICMTDIPKEHISTASNGKQYVNITISKKKEVDQYGKDLTVVIDTWKPEKKEQVQEPSQSVIDESQDLPF